MLLVAVAVLFYFQFSGKGDAKPKSTYDAGAIDSLSSHLKIAIVNYDTIWQKYKLVKDLNDELEDRRSVLNAKFDSRSRSLENEIQSKGKAFQAKVQDYESKASDMSEFKMKQAVIELQEEEAKITEMQYAAQQELGELQETYASEIGELQLKNSTKAQKAIVKYINEYNQDHNFTLIMANAAGGALLHADQRMDITKDILTGLNEKYEAQKKEEENKK